MVDSQSSQISLSAAQILGSATTFLEQRFGPLFDECVSVGVIGSYARDDFCTTSDLDYYVVFDLKALPPATLDMRPANLSELIEETLAHVRRLHPTNPFAARFSVYWSSLECLQSGRYDVGRFPAYDRLALVDHGKRLAGKAIRTVDLPEVTPEIMVIESAAFFVGVLREKLESAGLFRDLDELGAAELEALGAVVLAKSITMPIRLLHSLQPPSGACIVSRTEVAVLECAKRYHRYEWWPLVDAALSWRQSPPASTDAWSSAAALFRAHLQALYVFCLDEFARVLEERNEIALAARFTEWLGEIAALGAERRRSCRNLPHAKQSP